MGKHYFFPRGKGPLVSVLIPTRKRPKHLRECIDSLFDLSENPEDIEVLLKVDDDDKETLKELDRPYWRNIKALVSPRGRGYQDIHKWLNQLSEVAKGDWLLIFNDDAQMVTPRWDTLIRGINSTSIFPGFHRIYLVLLALEEYGQHDFSFPLVRRGVIESLGFFAPHPMSDNWIYRVLHSLDAVFDLGVVRVRHNRNETKDVVREEAIRSGDILIRSLACNLDSIKHRSECATKLLSILLEEREKRNWVKEPTSSGWYWWRKSSLDLEYVASLFLREEDQIVSFDQLFERKAGTVILWSCHQGGTNLPDYRELGGEWCPLHGD